MAEEVKDYMLTTLDNPWNPFTNYDEWLAFDIEKGYDTPGVLDRFSITGNNLTEAENQKILNEAMDRIIDIDPFCRWIKVTRESFEELKKSKKKDYEYPIS